MSIIVSKLFGFPFGKPLVGGFPVEKEVTSMSSGRSGVRISLSDLFVRSEVPGPGVRVLLARADRGCYSITAAPMWSDIFGSREK